MFRNRRDTLSTKIAEWKIVGGRAKRAAFSFERPRRRRAVCRAPICRAARYVAVKGRPASSGGLQGPAGPPPLTAGKL